jgi:hypothetical protein
MWLRSSSGVDLCRRARGVLVLGEAALGTQHLTVVIVLHTRPAEVALDVAHLQQRDRTLGSSSERQRRRETVTDGGAAAGGAAGCAACGWAEYTAQAGGLGFSEASVTVCAGWKAVDGKLVRLLELIRRTI